MTAEPVKLARSEAHPRARRFAMLRAAQRALAPSFRDASELPSTGEARAVLAKVQPLLERVDRSLSVPQPRPIPELLEADTALEGYARRLQAALDRVQIAQLRSWLGVPQGDRRTEALALLDLCLEDPTRFDERIHMVDLLVTRLVTVEYEGLWSVVHDPTDLTPLLRERCMHADVGTEVESELTRRLRLACDRVQAGDSVPEVADEIRGLKSTLGKAFFAPEVLRCVVYFNVALRNSRESALIQARVEDRAIDRVTVAAMEDAGSSPAAAELAPSPPPVPAGDDVEMHARREIEAALRRRVRREAPVPGPASELAGVFDLATLGRVEIEAFRSEGQDPIAETIRQIVAVGLTLAQGDAASGTLLALGTHPGRVASEWPNQLGLEVQAQIGQLIGVGAYDRATQLSDLKGRYLHERLLEQSRKRRRPAARDGDLSAVRDEWETYRRERDARPAEPPKQPRRPSRWPVRRLALAAGLAAILGGTGWIATQRMGDTQTPKTLGARQLGEVSPLLASAYRSEGGRGSQLFATLGPHWQALDAERRRSRILEIGRSLSRQGVREAFFYDAGRILQARFAAGEVRYLRPPDPPTAESPQAG